MIVTINAHSPYFLLIGLWTFSLKMVNLNGGQNKNKNKIHNIQLTFKVILPRDMRKKIYVPY